jgi:DNA-binding NarL/FixJ family response regulator
MKQERVMKSRNAFMNKGIRILLADDRPLVRSGIRALLEKSPTLKVVAEAADSQQLLRLAGRCRPDVVILDAGLPNGNGSHVTALLHHRQHPRIPVIMLSSGKNGEQAHRAFEASASGFLLLKSKPRELEAAIRRVVVGRTYLDRSISRASVRGGGIRGERHRPSGNAITSRQTDTLRLIAEGKNTKEIAASLRISSKTVDFHRRRLMDRLKTSSVAGLVREALRRGLIEP